MTDRCFIECIYLAKKDLDSLTYLNQNFETIRSNLYKYNKLKALKHSFILNIANAFDEYFKRSNQTKKEVCQHDEDVDKIYNERDKNIAHKDSKYCSSIDLKKTTCFCLSVFRKFLSWSTSFLPQKSSTFDPNRLFAVHPFDLEIYAVIELENRFPPQEISFSLFSNTVNMENLAIERIENMDSLEKAKYPLIIDNRSLSIYTPKLNLQDWMIKTILLTEVDLDQLGQEEQGKNVF